MINQLSKVCDTLTCAESADVNINETERTISTVAGGVLLLYGLSKFSLTTLLIAGAGAALIYRGVTGHCDVYEALETSTTEGQLKTTS